MRSQEPSTGRSVSGTGAAYAVSAMVTPVDGDALQGLIQRDQLVNVRASTTAVDDARGSAVAAIDGDPGTTWVADADDEDPTLSVSWLGERTVRSVRVTLDRQAAASRATRVELEYPGGSQSVELDDDGHRARQTVPDQPASTSASIGVKRTTNGSPTAAGSELGVGVSELRLGGTGCCPSPCPTCPSTSAVPSARRCGSGPRSIPRR